ncbi:hypothetical protein L227DRAFT_31933 [Lentinus tigrinus ALCF2SS1-6]|uniref:Uncharacterized protein n=1 Tax=Lentinus tigrinus ALCF2SS1-6 TaxID=1328759 RepID=A0A5C2SF57_9APHY|nr:hypothetical protein L227DRAFT_31933 [Lentinus tigrinus ALCF2SS1-6]
MSPQGNHGRRSCVVNDLGRPSRQHGQAIHRLPVVASHLQAAAYITRYYECDRQGFRAAMWGVSTVEDVLYLAVLRRPPERPTRLAEDLFHGHPQIGRRLSALTAEQRLTQVCPQAMMSLQHVARELLRPFHHLARRLQSLIMVRSLLSAMLTSRTQVDKV